MTNEAIGYAVAFGWFFLAAVLACGVEYKSGRSMIRVSSPVGFCASVGLLILVLTFIGSVT